MLKELLEKKLNLEYVKVEIRAMNTTQFSKLLSDLKTYKAADEEEEESLRIVRIAIMGMIGL